MPARLLVSVVNMLAFLMCKIFAFVTRASKSNFIPTATLHVFVSTYVKYVRCDPDISIPSNTVFRISHFHRGSDVTEMYIQGFIGPTAYMTSVLFLSNRKLLEEPY